MATSPGPLGKDIGSAADNNLTVHSTLFFSQDRQDRAQVSRDGDW